MRGRLDNVFYQNQHGFLDEEFYNDQFENAVSGQNGVVISGDEDTVRLRILADKHSYNVGDRAKVKLHWRALPTAFGFMRGTYEMETGGGETFDAQIADFELSEPYSVN